MMTKRKSNIALIFGGMSGEHEVSLMSARSVLSVIDRDKYNVIEIGITRAGSWLTGKNVLEAFEQHRLENLRPAHLLSDPSMQGLYVMEKDPNLKDRILPVDVYFPLVHGTHGEDGSLQGLFELAGAAYVGANIVSSAVGMDKGVFKSVMTANGIPVVNSLVMLRSEIEKNMDEAASKAETVGAYPLFIKPANSGSSVGITKCSSRADVIEGLQEATLYDRRIIIEQGIQNPREIEISLLGNDDPEASVAGEIIPGAEYYSYEAKYLWNSARLCIPALISAEEAQLIKDYAVRAYKAVDCCGMARVDFLIDSANGKIYLNEINTIPGFTQISMYPKLWEASGLPYPALIDKLIDLAVERKTDRGHTIHQYRREK